MNIFIAVFLLFMLVSLISWAYETEPNRLFFVSYLVLCKYLSSEKVLTEHPFIDIEAVLAVIIFCILGQCYEMYYRVVKKVHTITLTIEFLLKGFVAASAIVYVATFLIWRDNSAWMLLMFASSAGAFVLVYCIERLFRYFHQPTIKPSTSE
ncbi:MAG: hypothetical protein ACI8WB_005909 [Phenylobacterium sp.]